MSDNLSTTQISTANAVGRVLGTQEAAALAFLCFIMLVSIVGNLCLVLHIRQTRRRTGRVVRINCFLVNLAVGDICVGSVVCTGELLFIVFGQWELGAVMCKLTVYTQSVCLASTAFLLVAMTVDRYEVIVRPLKILRRNSRVARRIIGCWAGALVFAAPQLLIFKQTAVTEVTESKNFTASRLVCASSGYTAPWQRKAYMLYVPLVVVAMPTVVMVHCYARIVLVIWRRTRAMRAAGHRRQSVEAAAAAPPMPASDFTEAAAACQQCSTGTSRLLSRAKIKAVFMSLTVVTAFLSCWLPYFLFLLITVYSDGALLKDSIVHGIAKHLVLVHSVLNPIIYFLFASRSAPVTRLCAACASCCCCCGLRDRAAVMYFYSSAAGRSGVDDVTGGGAAVSAGSRLDGRLRPPQQSPAFFECSSSASDETVRQVGGGGAGGARPKRLIVQFVDTDNGLNRQQKSMHQCTDDF